MDDKRLLMISSKRSTPKLAPGHQHRRSAGIWKDKHRCGGQPSNRGRRNASSLLCASERIQDAGQMVSQVINALSPVAATGHGESRTLSEVVKSVETKTLLVLDNAEDCIEKTSSEQSPSTSFKKAVKEIIDSNRKVKLLLTSRVRFQSVMPSVCESLSKVWTKATLPSF